MTLWMTWWPGCLGWLTGTEPPAWVTDCGPSLLLRWRLGLVLPGCFVFVVSLSNLRVVVVRALVAFMDSLLSLSL